MAGLAVLWLGTRGMAGVWFPPVPAPSHQARGSPRLRARLAGPSNYTAQQTLLHCTRQPCQTSLGGAWRGQGLQETTVALLLRLWLK